MKTHTKGHSILCYITWIGFVVVLFIRDKNDAIVRQHLNQALALNLIATAGRILYRFGGLFSVFAEVVDLGVLVLAIMGIVRAAKMSGEPLPLVGDIQMID